MDLSTRLWGINTEFVGLYSPEPRSEAFCLRLCSHLAHNDDVFRHWVPDISLPSSVPEYKVETLYSGTGTVPEFWRGYLKKWCVHISAHQESFSGTVLGHQV